MGSTRFKGNWVSATWVPQDSKETGSVQVGFHKIQRWGQKSQVEQKQLVDKESPCSVSNEWKIHLIISQPSWGKSYLSLTSWLLHPLHTLLFIRGEVQCSTGIPTSINNTSLGPNTKTKLVWKFFKRTLYHDQAGMYKT